MNLREFVAATLEQVCAGVKDAQEQAKEYGGVVNPEKHRVTVRGGTEGTGAKRQAVDFDVAVTAAEESRAKGGIAVVAAVSFGGQRERQTANESVSRVRFSVEVELPASPHQPKPDGHRASVGFGG